MKKMSLLGLSCFMASCSLSAMQEKSQGWGPDTYSSIIQDILKDMKQRELLSIHKKSLVAYERLIELLREKITREKNEVEKARLKAELEEYRKFAFDERSRRL